MIAASLDHTAPAGARRSLVALGSFRREHRYAMGAAAEQAGYDLETFVSPGEATAWLTESTAHCILVDATVQGADQVCVEARAQSRLAQVPILAVAREVSDLAFAEVFGWGGDDVVELGAVRSLMTRLRALPPDAPAAPALTRGRAVVADADRQSRIVLGRVLRNAGYDVTFAATAEDVVGYAKGNVELVVASAEVGDARELVTAAGGASPATWIVRARPRDLKGLRGALADLPQAVVTDGYAPPENVLFLANELANRRGTDHRSSARLLYGASVAFRGAGRERDEHGFTYNVSAGGLYVRTLSPPEDDVVWLELVPPRSDRRVRLEGKVAWRRRFGPTGHATVPPGFGLQITDGSAADLAAWREGYAQFARALG